MIACVLRANTRFRIIRHVAVVRTSQDVRDRRGYGLCRLVQPGAERELLAALRARLGKDSVLFSRVGMGKQDARRRGDHSSRRAIVEARERKRQVVQLIIRGLTWGGIAQQLGTGDESTARKAFDRAIKRFPPADVELPRKLQSAAWLSRSLCGRQS
jgi:hypothetical protein